MKISSKLMILCLLSLQILCMPIISYAQHCKSMTCGTIGKSYITISFPFRIINRQSCGCPGFELYCDDKLGAILELPNAVNFTIDGISYSYLSREIELSDPNGCLPQKLLSLDLFSTPFQPIASKYFWFYNCTGVSDHYNLHYDEIGCLSGSNFTVVSADQSFNDTGSNCEFVKTVSIPTRHVYYHDNLSTHSSIHLTWDESTCGRSLAWIAGVVAVILLMLICGYSIWYARRSRRIDEASIVPTTDTNHAISGRQNHNVPGLDQTTINSYPMVVIGESGRLIKPDDDNCPICLTDYLPGDTLKMLPECLHRFHADCIDLWLSANTTCPICRTSPLTPSQ